VYHTSWYEEQIRILLADMWLDPAMLLHFDYSLTAMWGGCCGTDSQHPHLKSDNTDIDQLRMLFDSGYLQAG
jgi:hypothetical protein